MFLVNARHVKNVAGRKSDVLDCQWLQQLMSYGLLQGAYRPADEIVVLRSYVRHRATLLRSQARHVQHMQKALTQMNIQLATVISDVVGVTGMSILRAILAGERDGHVLAQFRDKRIRASKEEIALSLQGNWRPEHLFALKQAVALYDFHDIQLAECEAAIEAQLQHLERHEKQPQAATKRSPTRNAPKFDLRTRLFKMCGVDLTRIDGINVSTALTIVAEVGTDLSRFPTVKQFTAWMCLCPGTKISGNKVLSGKTHRCANRAAHALKLAATTLRSSKSALGAYYRRLCARMDKAKAVTAAAHKLARLIYAMLTKGEEYADMGQQYFEDRYRERVVRQLRQRAAKLGMTLVPTLPNPVAA